ncbi:ABC transporter substrate-binding protein [Metabacillus halosaccharovorans]|uniref:ABC transporter substrate-binding protein n=1 Tax=Metabacillus halosaccharovorans TaxID=930124 RepID=UPI00203C697C|nr:ABC transporter substrate-binding protein [Metabacillus halosaccharovorans]MCM3443124.1 ABC transporter substrate-binding protein [Metabacillus halosaccharovorans]
MFKNKIKALMIVIIAMFVTACSSQSSTTGGVSGKGTKNASGEEVVEIEFLHMHSGDTIERLVEKYHESQDKVRVKPTFVEGSYEGIIEQVQMRATTDSIPDIITNGFVYTRFAIDTLPIVPVQQFIDEEGMDTSDFFPSMLSLGKGDDGIQYAMPFAVSTPILYINADHFREVGLDPNNPPKTWEEVREAAKKLSVNDRYGIYFDYQITGNWLFQAMTETAGGQMMNKDITQVAFDSDAGRKALQYWVDLVRTDKSMPNIDPTQATQSFLSGNTSMYVTTTAGLSNFREQSKFDLQTALFPTVDGKPRVVPGGGNNLVILSKDPEKQKAAWDFMKFATSPEGTTFIAQDIGYMVTRESALNEPNLMGDFLKENPTAKVTYDQVNDMVPWYNFPGSAGSRVYQLVQDNIQAALLGEKTVDEAISDASNEANKLLE